jgi:hypothetical protein
MSGMRYQPQRGSRVNMSHPLAAGLVDVWIPHETSCGLITGYDSETRSVGTNRVTTEGIGYNLSSVPRRYSTTIFNNQSIAWLIVAHRDGSTGNKYSSVVKKDLSVIALQEWDASVRAIMWVPGSAANISYSLTAPLRNKVNVFAGVVGPSEKGVMVNGGEFKTFTGGSTIVATTNALGIGGDAKGTERAPQWTTLAVFAWQGDKLPTSAELRDLSMNPWQLLSDDTDEDDFSIEQIRRLYMNQGNYTEIPPLPASKPLVMVNGVIREQVSNEGQILTLQNGRFQTNA